VLVGRERVDVGFEFRLDDDVFRIHGGFGLELKVLLGLPCICVPYWWADAGLHFGTRSSSLRAARSNCNFIIRVNIVDAG
jgi:hypothetical protein